MKLCDRGEECARVLSAGDDESSLSLEQWSDRDDVSTLGQNEDWTMSQRSSQADGFA